MKDECKKCGPQGCCGPCYDFCGCWHCWFGWGELTLWQKIKGRIEYLWLSRRVILHKGLCAWWYS
jgi:hypothetical protein